MALDQQEIEFKKRARRRLVGAIALVLLMVTILPMILDDRSGSQPQQEIAITIPSQDDEEFTSKVAPLTEEVIDLEPAVEPAAEPKQAPSAAKPVEPDAPIAKAPESKPEAQAAKPATAKPAATPTVPATSTSKSDGYLIQVGVFSDAANVKQLEDKLKAQNLKAYTEKLQTEKGEKIRLRTGPYASKADAEKALLAVQKAGLSGMIITNK
jgi:DedD protein